MHDWTRAELSEELRALRARACTMSERLAVSFVLGLLADLYPDRHEIIGPDRSPAAPHPERPE